jgi:signal transduction histidine kinase
MDKMMDFLRGQFDYIYFFYGLSFLFLALICFNIDQKRTHALPWFLLGFFGLVHGANEWLDLVVITYGHNRFLSVAQPVFLGVSYILLLEFALIGSRRLGNRALVRRWVYLLLFGMLFLAAQSGDDGLEAGIRYFLGFPSVSLAAVMVFQAARVERKERLPLYALSVILVFYAFITGIIVPRSDFLLAPQVNFDSFFKVFKFPAQLGRGILALCAAMAVWFYSSILPDLPYKPQKSWVSLRLTKWIIVVVMVFLIGLGWVATNVLDYYANMQIIKNAKEKNDSPLNYLIQELRELEKKAALVSRALVVRNAVLFQKDAEKVKALFDTFYMRFDMRSCSLLDTQGLIIASVGEIEPEKSALRPYIPLKYFKGALSGDIGFSLSTGSKYSDRIYYVSYPVKDNSGNVKGVVLLTKIIPVKPVLQYRFFIILITLFVCLLTITFFIVLRKRESLIDYIEQAHTQLQEIDNLKTDFISIVSHELRTPLTAINNAATILLKGKLSKEAVDPREKELIEIIIKNTQRQTRMVGDLLDTSKIEAGVMPVCIEQADVVALVSEAMRAFYAQAAEKNITLEMFSNVQMSIIHIDPEHSRRILANLLSNALKYTPEGGLVKVKINDEFWEVIISVSDTGPGILKEERVKLFSKFYRASDTDARQHGGTGLGLMITKGLVEAQGGRIWLESEAGKGSTFYFTLVKSKKKTKQEMPV